MAGLGTSVELPAPQGILLQPVLVSKEATVLNIVFLVLAALLLWRFFSTRGLSMLRMMNRPMPESEHSA